jgi:S1-C subfamily serine protease
VAIIQLHEKEKIMPKDAYIFKIPDADPLEGNKEANSDYEIWVLGYSYGPGLANVDQGIHPSHTKGNISSTNQQYLVQYTSANEGGSSGGPVLNKKRELVAINNSGISGTQFRYGVRTKYIKELFDKVHANTNEPIKK